MNKVLVGLGLSIVVVVIAAVSSVSAITASGNAGSIVKISNTCSDMASVANNNRGSIVKIDGGGQCDINDILKGSAVSNNAGSIIKISNVCGNTSALASNNAGSIIKIESNGPCKKDVPTTVVVTEKESDTTATPLVTELPQTGLGMQLTSLALIASGIVYLAAYFANGSRVAHLLK